MLREFGRIQAIAYIFSAEPNPESDSQVRGVPKIRNLVKTFSTTYYLIQKILPSLHTDTI